MSMHTKNDDTANPADQPPRSMGRHFSFNSLARSAVKLGLKAKGVLRDIPAVRRVYYSIVNADAFDNMFWHDLMLADRVRMENYERAIKKHIQAGMVVADLGTGTGILACLAAQRGAKVYAIEHANIIERARELAACNGLNIHFEHKHSKDFHPPEKIDVLLHEQIGMNLVDEDMVENILDLRERVLKPDGKILPAYFSLFIDPIELRDDRRLPYVWEQTVGGLDFSCFKPATPPWQEGTGYDKRAVDPQDVKTFLAKRQRVLSLDLQKLPSTSLPPVWEYSTRITTPGRLDGFCLYFHIGFDEEIGFSTGPDSPPTAWGSRLLRCEARDLPEGAQIHFKLRPVSITNAATWTWEYSLAQTKLDPLP
jgi:type I protein arginine methyltransferase